MGKILFSIEVDEVLNFGYIAGSANIFEGI